MLHVCVRVRARLFARGERWLGHGQGDALIFPWGEREVGRRCDALKLHLAGHATDDESRGVRDPPLLLLPRRYRACFISAIGLAENSIRAREINPRDSPAEVARDGEEKASTIRPIFTKKRDFNTTKPVLAL